MPNNSNNILSKERFNLDQVNYIAQLGTLKKMLQIAEKTADYLTTTLQSDINSITKNSIDLEKIKNQIEALFQQSINRILITLKSQNISGKTAGTISKELVSAVSKFDVEIVAVFTEDLDQTFTNFSTEPFFGNSTSQKPESNSSSNSSSNFAPTSPSQTL